MSQDILFDRIGAWGVVTLNRPQALNALTLPMCEAMRARLLEWERDSEVEAVLIKGAGEKAFCAGGDIRWLHDEARKSPAAACRFFHEEYRLNALIHHYVKPYVAIIDGVVMGGGVGVSVHGDFRLVGDRTLFAMPETGIGLFPDVGGGHFLPRLRDGLGLYYALTGARAKAADCLAAGVATHYAPSARLPEIEAALLAAPLEDHAHGEIEAILDRFAADPGPAPINDVRGWIARHFSAPLRFEDLWARLRDDDGVFGIEAFETLRRMSPTSMKLAFEQLRRGREMDFNSVMKMEFRMARRCMEGRDFFEGVRAQIIDKDRRPKWNPADVGDVADADIERYFAPLADGELTLP